MPTIAYPTEETFPGPATYPGVPVLIVYPDSVTFPASNAYPASAVTGTATIGQAAETDTAQPIAAIGGGNLVGVIGQATSTSVAQPVVARTIKTIGQATATGTAQPITPVNGPQVATVGQATGTNLAQPIVAVGGPDITAPAAPRGLTVTPTWHGAHLMWIPNREPDLAGYEVQRRYSAVGARPAGPWAIIAPLITDPAYIDTGRTNGETYEYRVRALDTAP
jgi:hypothetical protein